MLNPVEGLQHANHSRDNGTFLGREGSQGKAHLQSAMEKGQEHHRYCAVLMVGKGTGPLGHCQQRGARRSHNWFSGPLCIAPLRQMEDKNKSGSWSGL